MRQFSGFQAVREVNNSGKGPVTLRGLHQTRLRHFPKFDPEGDGIIGMHNCALIISARRFAEC